MSCYLSRSVMLLGLRRVVDAGSIISVSKSAIIWMNCVPPSRELEQAAVTIDGMSDHTVSQSLYLRDPDGNEVELYVDADESVWKNNPAAVLAPIKPLHL